MFEAKCYDMHGNSIDGFTQWDINQSMVIKLESCDDVNHNQSEYIRVEPNVHFSNVKRDKALVVRASVVGNDVISVQVPNILLTEPYPLLIYVYYTNKNDGDDYDKPTAQATIIRTEIPVRKRDEPHDYYYVENIDRITAEQIKGEITRDTEETRRKAIEDIIYEKGIAVDAVNEEERLAVDAINSEEESALQAVAYKQASAEATLQEYVDEGYQIKEDTDAIKSDTQTIKEETDQIKSDTQVIHDATATIKEETQEIADTTAETITADIYNRIEVVGLQLYTTDDGNGNVTTTIVIPQE